jgi:hypothetical protein
MNWVLIEDMVSRLGDLYALEVEASNFPEITEAPPLVEVRLALLRATDAMSRLGAVASAAAMETAHEALESAGSSASQARRLIADARALRNRKP